MMYLLRRTAARAISSAPSKTLFVKPRSITTYTPAFKIKQQQWITPALHRRFLSDDASKPETTESAAVPAKDFSQTVQEAPIEDGLTPAQEASATAGVEALEAQTESTQPSNSPDANCNLYVGNLYYEVKEDTLKRIFSRFGAIENVKIIRDGKGLSKGFGYVQYQNPEDAQSAIDNLDMQVFEGRNLVVQLSRPRVRRDSDHQINSAPIEPSKTLFIGNMSFEMSDKDLNELFRDIRNVVDVRVAIDRRTGQPRGFAHADFVDITSATMAKEALHNKEVHGRKMRVDFAASGNKNAREQSARNHGDTITL